MRMLQRIAVITAAVLGALAMSVAPAQADGGAYTSDGNGSVWFESYGEHLYVNDWDADGHGVVGQVEKVICGGDLGSHCWSVRMATVYNGNGYHGAAEHENLDFKEGTHLVYRACLVDGADGDPYRCGGWEHDYA